MVDFQPAMGSFTRGEGPLARLPFTKSDSFATGLLGKLGLYQHTGDEIQEKSMYIGIFIRIPESLCAVEKIII